MKLKDWYQGQVRVKMREKFGYRNLLATPKIEKVVINSGVGRLRATDGRSSDSQLLGELERILAIVTGQKPVKTLAKKAIAAFKTRKGQVLGLKVTLRGGRMYDFLERLIHLALPRTRDFDGLKKEAMDKSGNLTIGIKEHIVFPEIGEEEMRHIFGFEVTVKTTAGNREKGLELLKLLGFPFKL